MKKRFLFLVTVIIIGAAALAGALLCERKSALKAQRPTLEYTDEQILACGYFDIIAAGGENRGLFCDVESYSTGDGVIHIDVPENVPEKAVVLYIRDADGNYLARRVYDLTGKVMIGPYELSLDHHTLPTLYYETEDHEVFDAMNASEEKDIICDGNMHICVGSELSKQNGWFREYFSTSANRFESVTASLQGRGNDSWHSNTKKSYTLRLKKAQNLLGLGSNKNWNLIGNAYDRSLLKNTVFNELSDRAGIAYQPKMQNINLYVDGKYYGVYTLSTKVSADRKRIPLKHGDFLYKMDPPVPEQPMEYTSKTWFEDGNPSPCADLCYPEYADSEELRHAEEILQGFIDTCEKPSFEELSNICDVRSLAKYYWIEEASMNFDAWQRSVYMYYTKSDGKLHMGPVWDMDRALGSPYDKAGMLFDSPEGWKVRCAGVYSTLFEDEQFRRLIYDEYYNGGIRDVLMSGMDEFIRLRDEMGEDADLNYLLFGHANDIGKPDIFNDATDYEEYFDAMTRFYRARMAWIDGQMSQEVIF